MPGACSSSVGRARRARGSRRTSCRARRRTSARRCSTWRAEDLGQRAGDHAEPGVQHPQVRAAAGPGRGGQQPDEPAVEEATPSRCGASRKSSADRRRRGVDDDQVPACRRVGVGAELAELLHRHVLLRAGEGAGRQRLVEGVGQDLRGLLRGRRAPRTTSSKVRFMSSIIASQRAAGRRRRRPATGRGVLSSAVEAHRLGQPAGRVDGEHDDLAARARRRAAPSAAAVVVLPTPPEPQQTTIRVAGSSSSASTSSSRACARRGRRGRSRVRAAHASPWSRSARPARRARRGRCRRPAAAARTSGGPSARAAAPLRVLERHAARRGRAASVEQRRRPAPSVAAHARPRPGRRRARAASSRPVARPRPGRRRRAAAARTMLTTTPPTGRPRRRAARAMPSTVSCTGISSSSVTRCTAVCGELQQPHDRVGLAA